MGRARPGGRFRDKSPLEEFRDLGGDARLLERLPRHPALKVIERLDNDETRRFKLAQRLAAVDATLDKASGAIGEVASWITAGDSMRASIPRWLEDIRLATQSVSRIKLGLAVERARHEGGSRKGLFLSHAERYFFAACLVPYTAWLNRSRGRTPSPAWEWIERWIRETTGLREETELHLRGWWAKEVLRRKSWPSRPLLYALAAGAAVPLEARKSGRRAEWIVEWRRLNLAAWAEEHPVTLKRRLSAADSAYLESVAQFVPLARRSLLRLYPDNQALTAVRPADPLEMILKRRKDEALEKLPPRARILAAKLRDEPIDTKAMLRKTLAELAAKAPPTERRRLKARIAQLGKAQAGGRPAARIGLRPGRG